MFYTELPGLAFVIVVRPPHFIFVALDDEAFMVLVLFIQGKRMNLKESKLLENIKVKKYAKFNQNIPCC